MADTKRDHLPIQFNTGNNLTASVASQQSTADEEIAPESDEPSDNCKRSLLARKLQQEDNMYKKHTIAPARSHKGDSLLTRAIISDSEPLSAESTSIYSRGGFRIPKRGMSTTSTVSSTSMPSTADLTSDGSDSSSSELSSPSPRVSPTFALPLGGAEARNDNVVTIKAQSDDDHAAVVETLTRKRCITFACPGPVRAAKTAVVAAVVPKLEAPTPIRRTTLKFACNVKDECKAPKKPHSPPPSRRIHRSPVLEAVHLNANAHHRRDSAATIVDERKSTAIPCKALANKGASPAAASIPRFYEFASSVDESVESWMNAPQFPARLLKVDCLLEKEKQIRKLSEEVDDEVALEEEEEQADDAEDYDIDEDEEDDGYKEDEEDDEYELWSDSEQGNQSNEDEEEDAADSDDEEELYVPNGTTIPDRQTDRPTCCRNTSDSSFASIHHSRKSGSCSFKSRTPIRSIRPRTPELPDSTDFVPGTFDEDKVLEDYYVSCMEDRKTLNKVIRPQDIDPSFPTEDNEDDDEAEEEEEERPVRMNRRRGSNASNSHSPRGSPAPTRRHRSPPPMSRRGSRGMSPNKRRPSFTAKSPPPQGRTGRTRFEFNTKASLARSTSLPRHGVCSRRKACFGSPKPTKAVPLRLRGALDIVKGLEKKRMRRRENVYGRREYRTEAGEGVEKMREIGILGRERLGANAPPKFVISV
ncbi:hypothetical protein H072_2061 [Dactylellina haptotyla CBS 200.50]|uniref:Uncharacterized protein n=1 Tax=Dactylellina haptotyla (strain CBS 200.50) TaxID=1284197 RepID=S8AM50_DACHA|nr:hypothetical protein H072_2061 [Dactylellina haptotyla CBS 200.50]